MTESEDSRRSFSSRTPVNSNPDRVAYRRGFVTRHQVSGWRFVMRRIASGVALHDARMLVDPLRSQSRAVLMGALILVTGVLGCFVFSLIRPGGVAGTDAVLADRGTSALYVRVGDTLHPVLNLTSARLIANRPDNPKSVKTSELDQFPRGNLLGIPGAPERTVQNGSRDAAWTACEGLSGDVKGVTVVAGPLDKNGDRASDLAANHAVLAGNEGGTWLLWDGRRSRVDLSDRAVTGALGLGADVPTPRPIAAGLLNAIPEAAALAAPAIPNAGEPPRFPLPVSAPVGAVVTSHAVNNATEYYAVLPDGLQPISPVLAAVLRNTNSFGLAQPPSLEADAVARMPVSRQLDVGVFPAERITLVDAASDPVTCASWTKPSGASTSSLALSSGSGLPLSDSSRTLSLVGAGTDGIADQVALHSGTGYFVECSSSLFWISDTGVRYGIDAPADKTAAALGLTAPPIPIPWAMLSLFAPGPALSRADALVAHDGLESR